MMTIRDIKSVVNVSIVIADNDRIVHLQWRNKVLLTYCPTSSRKVTLNIWKKFSGLAV